MPTEPQPIPDLLLERYLAGDLAAEDARRIQEACETHPEVRARFEALAAERNAYYLAHPSRDFAHKLASRLEHERETAGVPARRASRWLTWTLAPSAAAAAALVVTVTVTRMSPDEVAPPLDAVPAPAVEGAPGEVTAPDAERRAAATEPAEGTPAQLETKARARKVAERESTRPSLSETKRGRRGEKKPKRRAKPTPPPVRKDAPAAVRAPRAPAAKPSAQPPPAADVANLDELATAEAERAAPRAASGRPARSRTNAEVRQIVAERVRQLKPCLRASDEVPPGAYTLELAWDINPAGDVKKLRWLQPKDLAETNMARCVLERVRAWEFPVADSKTTIERLPVTVQVD